MITRMGHTGTVGCPNSDGLEFFPASDTSLLKKRMESTANISSFEINVTIGKPGVGRTKFQWVCGYDITTTETWGVQSYL